MDQAPGSMVYRIYFGGPNMDFIREMASVAERLRLTFLATRDGYLAHQREGLDVGVWEGGTTSPVTPWQRSAKWRGRVGRLFPLRSGIGTQTHHLRMQCQRFR